MLARASTSHAGGRVEIAANNGHNRASFAANPHHDHAHLRRFQARPFRHVRTAPRHARGDPWPLPREFDPQPMHLDEAAAQQSMLKGLSGSGWHLVLDHDADDVRRLYRPHRLAAARPASTRCAGSRRCGRETISTLDVEVVEARVSRSRPETGIVTFKGVVRNAARRGVVRDGVADHRAAARRSRGGVGRSMRFFEDIEIGARREIGSFTFTADDDQEICRAVRSRSAFISTRRRDANRCSAAWRRRAGMSASVCMKLLVADGQRQAREAAARGEKIAVWGPSPGFRELRWIRAGAGRRYHQLRQRGRNQAHLGEASRMGHPAGPQHRHQPARRTGVSRSWRRPSCRGGMRST